MNNIKTSVHIRLVLYTMQYISRVAEILFEILQRRPFPYFESSQISYLKLREEMKRNLKLLLSFHLGLLKNRCESVQSAVLLYYPIQNKLRIKYVFLPHCRFTSTGSAWRNTGLI